MKLRAGSSVVKVEVARDLLRQSLGLMFRKSLAKNSGMLFVFPFKFYYGIWMFGMRFPIDILWLDENMEVVDMKEGARPCWVCGTYYPARTARYVLEVETGFAKRNGIRIGSKFSPVSE